MLSGLLETPAGWPESDCAEQRPDEKYVLASGPRPAIPNDYFCSFGRRLQDQEMRSWSRVLA